MMVGLLKAPWRVSMSQKPNDQPTASPGRSTHVHEVGHNVPHPGAWNADKSLMGHTCAWSVLGV